MTWGDVSGGGGRGGVSMEGRRMMMVVGDTYIVLVLYQVYSKHLVCGNSLKSHLMRQLLLFSLLHRGGNRHTVERLSSCPRSCNWNVGTLGFDSRQSGSRVLF